MVARARQEPVLVKKAVGGTVGIYRCIKFNGSGQIVVATVGDVVEGVVQVNAQSGVGQMADVVIAGPSPAFASGTIKEGQRVAPDIGGAVRVAVAGDNILGLAMEDALASERLLVDVDVGGGTSDAGSGGGGGANTALSNLTTTALNEDLHLNGHFIDQLDYLETIAGGSVSADFYTSFDSATTPMGMVDPLVIQKGLGGVYTCLAGVTVGQAVKVSASDTVAVTDASSAAGEAQGIVVLKPTTTSAVVVWGGAASVFSGLTPGADYWLSDTPGAITASAPTATGSIQQRVGTAKNATTLEIGVEHPVYLNP